MHSVPTVTIEPVRTLSHEEVENQWAQTSDFDSQGVFTRQPVSEETLGGMKKEEDK